MAWIDAAVAAVAVAAVAVAALAVSAAVAADTSDAESVAVVVAAPAAAERGAAAQVAERDMLRCWHSRRGCTFSVEADRTVAVVTVMMVHTDHLHPDSVVRNLQENRNGQARNQEFGPRTADENGPGV